MIKKYLAKSKTTVLLVVVLVVSGCGSNNESNNKESSPSEDATEMVVTHTPETLELEIEKQEALVEDLSIPNHAKMVAQLIEFYESFAQLFSKNELAPEMLFRAGNQSVNLQKYNQALSFYNTVENEYRFYIKRPECLYLQGFIYETYLNELGNAQEKYEMVVSEYPNHMLTSQAQQSIENMGMSDEDLIKKFENQNK